MNAHVTSVSNILRMFVTSTEIDFSIITCRFINFFFVSGTMLAILKVIRLFSTENKFYTI